MTIRETLLTTAIGLAVLLTAPAFANDPDWNGDPPTEEPGPPNVTQPAVTRTEGSDRTASATYYPCCIKAGEVVPLRNLFSPRATKRMCERAVAGGDAVILECPGVVSAEALK